MKLVVIVQTILPHYRSSLFHLLVKEKGIRFKILAGKTDGGIKEMSITNAGINNSLCNHILQLAGHRFIFQSGLFSAIKALRPDFVLLGGPDVHVVSNLLLFFYLRIFTKTEVHWWTHGVSSKQSILRSIQLFLIKFSNGVLTYEVEGKNTITQFMKSRAINITVLKNAINTEDYGLLLDHRKNKKAPFCILFAGRLTLAKRCDILIKSAKRLKDAGLSFRVEIIGNGPELNTCKSLVDTLQLNDYVTFHGAKYDDELRAIFSRADIFVLPGKVGLSALHALSYGLPVLTTDQDIHSPEIALIKKGYNGDFFQGFSEESLAIKIQEWMKILEEDNERIKSRVKKTVQLAGYTPEAMVENFVKHFKNLK